MTATLIVLALGALGVGIVVWATRRKASQTRTGPRETDTAWNDPVTPAEPARAEQRPDEDPHAKPAPVLPVTPPTQDPRA